MLRPRPPEHDALPTRLLHQGVGGAHPPAQGLADGITRKSRPSPAEGRPSAGLRGHSCIFCTIWGGVGWGRGNSYFQTPCFSEAQRPPVALIPKGDFRCPSSAINLAYFCSRLVSGVYVCPPSRPSVATVLSPPGAPVWPDMSFFLGRLLARSSYGPSHGFRMPFARAGNQAGPLRWL